MERGLCGSVACVDVKVGVDALDVDGSTVDGVLVSSTIEGNDDTVRFTRGEWDQFLLDVRAGKWDHTQSPVSFIEFV